MLPYRKIVLLTVLVVMIQLFDGCVLGNRNIYLENKKYEPQKTATPRNNAVCVPDVRSTQNSDVIGYTQNGYGMKLAEVIAMNSITEWVSTGIRDRLRSEGYRVETECEYQTGILTLKGTVIKVYTAAYMTYLGEVVVDMSVSSDGKKMMNKQITGYKKTGTNWGATEKSYVEVLGAALDNFLDQLVHEVNRIDTASILTVSDRSAQDNAQTAEQQGLQEQSASGTGISAEGALVVGPLDIAQRCPQQSGVVEILSGKRTASGVKSKMTGISPFIQAMYRDRFELDSTLEGKVCVRFTIASSGKVADAEIVATSLEDPPIENALIDSLSRVRFGSFVKPSGNSEALYSVEFRSETAKSSKAVTGFVLAILIVVSLVILLVAMPPHS